MKTRVIIRNKIFTSAFFLAGLLQTAPAVDWYVATNGAGLGTNGWADATNNLQGAINMASTSTYDVVWVSNGLYETGGTTNYPSGTTITNRIVIAKSITVRSKDNDPTNTIIKGAWDPIATNGPAAVRCVYMTSNSWLIGFTVTNGATKTTSQYDNSGGGIYCTATNAAIISNCIIAGNSALGQVAAPYTGGGGTFYGTLFNCRLIGNLSGVYGGGAKHSILSNCTLIGNSSVTWGGGASESTLYGCTLTNNSSTGGGGAESCALNNCTLTGNRATANGGGVYGSALTNCTLIGNRASGGLAAGGGANGSILYNCAVISNTVSGGYGGGGGYNTRMINCILSGNYSDTYGGGVNAGGPNQSVLYNCLVTGNKGPSGGGGACNANLYNCTVVGNSAGAGNGGGIYYYAANNCIVYFNEGGVGVSNWSSCTFTNTCTAPSNTGWAAGNITGDPMLIDKGSNYGTNHVAGNYRLLASSPCINAGTNASWTTTYPRDYDSRQRIRYGIVDMGAYETIRGGTIYGFR